MILRYDQGMNTHPDANVKVIENAARDDVRPGDHITWDHTRSRGGVNITAHREGVAYHRDENGDWWAEDGTLLTDGEGKNITLTIRRADSGLAISSVSPEYITPGTRKVDNR